jgi:hypothetical protein
MTFDLDPKVDLSGEVTKDAVELTLVATFNGLCRLVAALAAGGTLPPSVLEGMHDAMATPLDDEANRDDPTVSGFRGTVDEVFSNALALSRSGLRAD